MAKSDDLSKKYEALNLEAIKKYQDQVEAAYVKAIDQIFLTAGYLSLKDQIFKLSDYPVLNNLVNKTLLEFHDNVNIILVNGVKYQWELSGQKNASIINETYGKTEYPEFINNLVYNPQESALAAFQNKKIEGLNLSDRVWNYTNQFQSEIEQEFYVGLSNGTPAAKMASEMKQYLKNPDMLFRRVKDTEGNLVLSKAAKEYHPGQGVYRSSYKNALRMTRETVNDSYRTSDQVRWKATPFILGYEIKTSKNHPKLDICDSLAGDYGKDFKWRGWHIQCICYQVPKLASKEQFSKYEDAVLSGDEADFKFTGIPDKVPANFTKWMSDNSDRMENWKSKPDWLTKNKI